MELKIKKMVKAPSYYDPPTPRYQSDAASGLDLCAARAVVIPPRATVRVPTGLCLEIPVGLEGQVRPRSGLASRGLEGILGTIDADYRGELHVMLRNNTPSPWPIREGDRIAQLVIAPVVRVEVEVVEELSSTARGERGFGSTGVSAREGRARASEGGDSRAGEIGDSGAAGEAAEVES